MTAGESAKAEPTSEAAPTRERNKLRLDFTPSEMGMLMGISLRLGPEPALKKKWDALLKKVVPLEAPPAAERTALKAKISKRLEEEGQTIETLADGDEEDSEEELFVSVRVANDIIKAEIDASEGTKSE